MLYDLSSRVPNTAATFLDRNVAFTECDCVCLIRYLADGEIVETVSDLGVGDKGGEEGVEVFLVGTVSCVVSYVVHTELSIG